MNEENKEKMLNLLADRAVFGLNDTEQREFEQLAKEFPELADDSSFEKAAAAFALVDLDASEPLPKNLNAKILADADKFFAAAKESAPEEFQKTFAVVPPKRSIFDSLGWLVAALACIALIANIWLTRTQKAPDIGGGATRTPVISPKTEPGIAAQREQLLASAGDVVQKTWTDFDPKKPRGVSGDVVWSNSQQKGFLRFHNLPANDKSKETYQLWIFDANQDAKTPVDGGVFDVDENGDVIIPIDAKIKIENPKMFAVTAEKPGGVVVSKLGKVMAVAKV